MQSKLRAKRNFKNLTLPNQAPSEQSPPSSEVINGEISTSTSTSTSVKTSSTTIKTGEEQITDQLSDLQVNKDLHAEDFEQVDELGRGNGGTVSKVYHKITKTYMARKIIRVEAGMEVKKQITRELQFMHKCRSPFIVEFFGAFMKDSDILICMEYMDVGSLDQIYKKAGPFPFNILKKTAFAIVSGATYLYDEHRIIHRDIKPSNVLVNSKGQIKLCDFGVSGQTVNSVADTFVGTSSYMSPERILGSSYSVKSDVWSLGITVMELAIGRFPFSPDGTPLAIFELLQHIVNEPAPEFPPNEGYPQDLITFVAKCLIKEISLRDKYEDLMKHEYLISAQEEEIDLEKWAKGIIEDPKKYGRQPLKPKPESGRKSVRSSGIITEARAQPTKRSGNESIKPEQGNERQNGRSNEMNAEVRVRTTRKLGSDPLKLEHGNGRQMGRTSGINTTTRAYPIRRPESELLKIGQGSRRGSEIRIKATTIIDRRSAPLTRSSESTPIDQSRVFDRQRMIEQQRDFERQKIERERRNLEIQQQKLAQLKIEETIIAQQKPELTLIDPLKVEQKSKTKRNFHFWKKKKEVSN